ncbi:MAG: nitroreductase [Acidobacteriia bacterium]|nr:nitroreductase [Terriglobia bacterium]
MTVTEAVLSRRSVRAFLDTPVPMPLIAEILRKASRAPSGGNVQPWKLYVLAGEPLDDFKALMQRRIIECPEGDLPLEYHVYPQPLKAPYRDYRFKNAVDYSTAVGIAREDKAGRQRLFANNYRFFGAPLALFCFIDREMGSPQWSDLGMFLQTVMLLVREAGLDSCAQECWSRYHRTVRDFLKSPEELMLFCGMAIGSGDPDAAANRMQADRAPLEDWCKFVVGETP